MARIEPRDDGAVAAPESGTVAGDDASRRYGVNPYNNYGDTKQIGIGNNDFEDDRLHPKTLVVGVEHDGTATAYPLPVVEAAEGRVVNDAVGGLPVVVAVDPGGSLVAYVRRVDGETLTFERASGQYLAAGGSRWDVVTGRAVDGPFEGTTLRRANDVSPEFWFAWAQFNPDTTIYGR